MDPSVVIQLVKNFDVLQLKLSAEEGFVLSRVDGRSSCDELILMTGLPQPLVMSALQKLKNLGVVQELGAGVSTQAASTASADIGTGSKQTNFSESKSAQLQSVVPEGDISARPNVGKKKSPAETPSEDLYADLILAPGDLRDDVDINQEQQKRILFFSQKIEIWNHFELLGLLPDASPVQVRKAYFVASKKFHPDAYFRKELGPFAQKIDRIFKAMKVAYDILSNDKTREAYAKTASWTSLAEPQKGSGSSASQVVSIDKKNDATQQTQQSHKEMLRKALQAAEAQAKRSELEKKRKNTVKKRRLKRNPMVQRIKKAAELYQLGIKAIADEKWLQAANHLALAVTFDPQKTKYHKSYSEAAGMANYVRAQNLLSTMDALEDEQDHVAILTFADELCHIAEDNAEIMAQAAQVVLKSGAVRRAFELAQISVSLQENYIPGLRVLADTAEKAEHWHSAQRALQRLIELKPQNKSYSVRLKQVMKKLK